LFKAFQVFFIHLEISSAIFAISSILSERWSMGQAEELEEFIFYLSPQSL